MTKHFALADELRGLSNVQLYVLIEALLAWLRGKTPKQIENLLDMRQDLTQDDLALIYDVAAEKHEAGEAGTLEVLKKLNDMID